MSDQEFTAKAELTLVPNGAILKIKHPERGTVPESTIERVFASRAALLAVIGELFDEYVVYPGK